MRSRPLAVPPAPRPGRPPARAPARRPASAPGPRRAPGPATLAALLFVTAAAPAPGIHLARARGQIRELRFTREGPRPQVFRFRPGDAADTDWPARLAKLEFVKRRRASRRASRWSGFVGTAPTWGVDGEVVVPAGSHCRIRRRLELWSHGPAGLWMHARAEDPGGRGRRWLETRAARLMRSLRDYSRGRQPDPFRVVREGRDGDRWREHYRFRLPGGTWVEVTGPVPEPLPPAQTEATGTELFDEFPVARAGAGAETRYRAVVPGYFVRFGPAALSPRETRWLAGVLGIDAGVSVAAAVDAEFAPRRE